MAKPTMLKLALVIALSMAASTAFAATAYSKVTSVGGTSFSSSQKVIVYLSTNGTSTSFDGTTYAVAGAHELGDKVIGAQASDSNLYFTTATAGSATAAASTITTGTNISTWTSM
jgi:uncharacterized protein YpuA (DUF1002 family)